MKQLEKEITETNKQGMMKRYQMYGMKVSKLTDKAQKDIGKGERRYMEYKDFVEQVKAQIQDFLPEKFADAEVTVHQVVKNNDCVLDGLTIRTEESNIAPTIYLNSYFEQILRIILLDILQGGAVARI